MMLEREIHVDHSTINRWVIHYSFLLETEFTKRFKRKTAVSWRMDETYIKVKEEWHYLYRAVDNESKAIDFMLSKLRVKASAKVFFTQAICSNGLPEKVTINKSDTNLPKLNVINFQITILKLLEFSLMQIHIRQIKYLNNIIEQDPRGIKCIKNPRIGFKGFHSAAPTLAGIELCRMLKKGNMFMQKTRQCLSSFMR